MKKELNRVAYAVRATQAVQQYGVGAMVDFPEQTLVTANPEEWENPKTIYDERFAKSLGVKWFATPTCVAYARFPEWYFCPKCRKFQSLNDWIIEHRRKNPNSYDSSMTDHLRCPQCNQDLVASRIVTVCESGHLNDFPWVKWVHAKSNKQVCSHPSLQFKTGTSSSEGLEGLMIKCASCGASSSLKGAFDKNCFEKLDEKSKVGAFFCKGGHPFKGKTENCQLYPRTMQRGGSSVYFPLTYSSIVIPPFSDKLRVKIEQSDSYAFYEQLLDEADFKNENEKKQYIMGKIDGWSEKIATEIGAVKEEVKNLLLKKWIDNDTQSVEASSVQYKMEEYDALSGKVSSLEDNMGDFVRTEMDVSKYGIPYLKSIALIEKVRVVTAFVGFSRINPVTKMTDKGFVEIKDPRTPWYPANEVRGEGIFIELDQDAIDDWLNSNPEVKARAEKLTKHYAESFVGSKHPKTITPRFVMLHTLSHLLIKQFSFECGYNIASLCERIYCSEKQDGQDMAGIFIYTSSGDSEGTLGGLVRQGRPDTLPRIIRKAINGARICSNDPVCMMSNGQGRESLNLAACHACMLLPETCCEERNSLLDRATIVGSYDKPEIGFWWELDMPANNPAKAINSNPVNSWTKTRPQIIESPNGENENSDNLPFKNFSYNAGELFINDYSNWSEFSNIVNSFDAKIFDDENVKLPDDYGGNFALDDKRIDSIASWVAKKVALVDDGLSKEEKSFIKENGWNVIDVSNIDISYLKELLGD